MCHIRTVGELKMTCDLTEDTLDSHPSVSCTLYPPPPAPLLLASLVLELGMTVHICNPSTWETEAGGLKFKTKLGSIRPYLVLNPLSP